MGLIGLFLFLIIVTASLLLGSWIFFASPKSKINIWFLAIAAAILLWNVFAYLGYSSDNTAQSLLFFRLNFCAVSLYFIAFYYFSIYFPATTTKQNRLVNLLVTLFGSFFAIVSLFSNSIISSVSIPEKNQLVMKTGVLGNYFYLFTVILTIYILIALYRKNHELSEENKQKTRYFLIGTILYALANVIFSITIAFIFPNNYNYTQLGDFSAIIFLGFTAYSITKHQLFNIKVIATKAIVVLLSLILFVEIFISSSTMEGALKGIVWLLVTYGGFELIKSVELEIKQRQDLAKLAEKLETANRHLKDIDKMKDDFLSMASHELNTPIAAIEGYLSMILQEGMGGKIPDKAREYLQTVFTSAQRLASLVRDLLNVSRIESGRIHIIYEEKKIEDVIEQATMEVASKAREAKHTLTFEKPKKALPTTWFDVTRVTEILINMLGNSIKYTPNGGKITIRAVTDDKKIVVSVEDNGKGIPKDREQAVFDKFSQVDVMKDEVKGTGLGMYIAKKFIELMNGKIWFHSDGADKGTTFYFSLPILKKKPYDAHEGEGAVLH